MKYLNLRNELIFYLKGLSDAEYQRSCWINHDYQCGIEYDEFDLAVHFLFDDTTLSSESESWIGLCLKNKEEAFKVKRVCDAIEVIFEKYGTLLSDREYVALPEWEIVLSAAMDAHKCLVDSV
ncbi:SCO4402 family protein [Methylomonas sp. CM2]|uniref:SCO4402 family protein n=1 Tax=Methylomonas sp. CM2 TaxID=3417647 RepID=UPI003CF98FDC